MRSYFVVFRQLIVESVSMTTLPHIEHVARRKAYAPHYNLSHLTQFQPEVSDSVIKVVQASLGPLFNVVTSV